jgi:hypothetical protein
MQNITYSRGLKRYQKMMLGNPFTGLAEQRLHSLQTLLNIDPRDTRQELFIGIRKD